MFGVLRDKILDRALVELDPARGLAKVHPVEEGKLQELTLLGEPPYSQSLKLLASIRSPAALYSESQRFLVRALPSLGPDWANASVTATMETALETAPAIAGVVRIPYSLQH